MCKKLSQISTASNRQKHLGARGPTYPQDRSWLSAALNVHVPLLFKMPDNVEENTHDISTDDVCFCWLACVQPELHPCMIQSVKTPTISYRTNLSTPAELLRYTSSAILPWDSNFLYLTLIVACFRVTVKVNYYCKFIGEICQANVVDVSCNIAYTKTYPIQVQNYVRCLIWDAR